ncbi:hypothetical protein BKA70DRAFT_1293300 [Coprinopsis sp. MPI-PUGE-AT-0042]|nr:hypothetical protein BKA70DRAFT_1293300 [Coprinopsis sp. MPI-PUGE-AT-0042]
MSTRLSVFPLGAEVHRCLQIPDLLLNIFEALLERPNEVFRPPSLATLAVLARTCKAFQLAAIRTLWREIPGLWVLSCLFPAGSVELNRGGQYVFARFLNKDEIWKGFSERLKVYRAHVRIVLHDWRQQLHASVLHSFRQREDVPIPLFPNAVNASIPCLIEAPLESIFYPAVVLSQTLRSVTLITNDFMTSAEPLGIQPKGATELWDAIQRRISPFAPSFQSFLHPSLLSRHQIDDILLQLSSVVTNVDIWTVSIGPAALLALSRLTQLEKLAVSIGARSDLVPEDQRRPSLAFPELTDIQVNILDEASGTSFLGQLCAPRLASCTMSFMLPNRFSDLPIETFLGAFSQHDHKDLTHLTINDSFKMNWDNGSFAFIVTYQSLRHLSPCRSLVKIDIFPSASPDSLHDEELAMALSSWPKLEELHLGKTECTQHEIPDEVRVTAGGVSRAVKNCPRLRSLTLQCDFRQLMNTSAVDEGHPTLSSWNVVNSPIASGKATGRWLKANFPALRSWADVPRILCEEGREKTGKDLDV